MKIIGVATSPRCGKVSQDELNNIIKSTNILDTIYEIGYKGNISNSEALLLAALWGAHKEGADVELVYEGDIIPEYDGAVFATPVYFGDRSSGLHSFIREANLKDKAIGVVSCGAKRNGGQETTNIYALYDCLNKGALITGNGPPTAQYGGTGWAGNKTAIVDDDFGIKTSYGTGIQVAKLAKLIQAPKSKEKTRILFLHVTKDHVRFQIPSFENSMVNYFDMTDMDIRQCLGCPVCPNGDLSAKYKCIIKKDEMDFVHNAILEADCIIFVSGTDDTKFQVFMERTRFIRRNHFELGERVYSSISKTDSVTDILPLRIMTNMLRHDMYGLPFWKSFREYENIDLEEYFKTIETYTRKSKTMRKDTGFDSEYTAVGYEDAKIDEKAYRD